MSAPYGQQLLDSWICRGTDGVELIRRESARVHVLTCAHTASPELTIYGALVLGVADGRLRAFEEEVNRRDEVGCLLPEAPISALPEAALRGPRHDPQGLRRHVADFLRRIPTIDAVRAFEHLVIALPCFGVEDWVTATLVAVLREHAALLRGRTVHLCVRQVGPPDGLGQLIFPGHWPQHRASRASWHAHSLLREARDQRSEVYWYPGGGQDLTPLLLLPERSVFGRRGFQPGVAAAPPLLLWITDPAPVSLLVRERGDCAYASLWRRLGAQCRIVGNWEVDLGEAPEGRHHVLDAEIVRARSGTQKFRFLYSEAPAEAFPAFFAARGVRVAWAAFIRATADFAGGGFGGGPSAQVLMPLLSRHFTPEEMPEVLIGDQHFADRGGWPGYERLGSREEGWSDGPVRADGRLRTGGVSGWGINYMGDGNVGLWARADHYRALMARVRRRTSRAGRGEASGHSA